MAKSSKKGQYTKVALACQGGGSLGAYHIGAYQAMDEAGYQPDVVSGISIGAFTAATIAGNDPEDRVEKLKGLWDKISWPEIPGMQTTSTEMHRMHNKLSSMQGFIMGQPNFFKPRNPGPKHQKKGTVEALSFYDTNPMADTLREFVDFDRINSGKTRLLLGSVKVKTGELVFFDSAKMKIGPEHVLASGSMPPGFPPQIIDGDMYWDGGCVSNTPLEGIFDALKDEHTLCFMIDLFCPTGDEPKDMDDVDERGKDILYSSRTAHHIGHVNQRRNLSKALHHMLASVPKELQKDPIVKEIKEMARDTNFDIVHVVYKSPNYEIKSKDCEFSKTSIKDRSNHGYKDMKKALDESPWAKERSAHIGSQVHRY
jgi:NTE family protein